MPESRAPVQTGCATAPERHIENAMTEPDAGPGNAILALDQRAREIFKEIVESYLRTGEPVGSRTLAKLGASGLSPASIRNTMADLAALGLLDAPHAMAGRRPSHQGLRFFVDSMLQVGEINEEERRVIDERMAVAGGSREELLNAASELLSGLAGGAGLVLSPRHEAPLRHVEFVGLGPGQTLCVLVFEDTTVENRILITPPGLPPSALTEAANFLNARFRGKTLQDARAETASELEHERARLDAAAAALITAGLAEWGGGDPHEQRALIVRGRANLLQDAQAQEDLEMVRQLFDDLEKTKELIQLLDLAQSAESVRIFIGRENKLFSLSGSSLIVSSYMNPQRRVVGALGVIGPTRLNYARVIPVVDYTAHMVGRLIDGRAVDDSGGRGRR
jgi:heat-inducible transcriptional repressor